VLVYELAGALSRLGGEVYVYRFNRLSPKNKTSGIGASHGEEVPYIFGHVDTEGYTGEDRELSEAMMKYWIQFCKTGNPNGPGLPHWPKFTARLNTYLAFDDDISTKNYADDTWFNIL
jgi:para-nitrobenzyl esterase